VLLLLEPAQQRVDPGFARLVDPRRRLVEEQHRGSPHQREGEEEALELSARKGAEGPCRVLHRQVHQAKEARNLTGFRLRHLGLRREKVESGERQIPFDVELLRT